MLFRSLNAGTHLKDLFPIMPTMSFRETRYWDAVKEVADKVESEKEKFSSKVSFIPAVDVSFQANEKEQTWV